MSRTVATAQRVTEGPSVTPDYLPGMLGVTPRQTQVSAGKSVTRVDLCQLLADAIDATGSRKEAAVDMGISAPVLSKQLTRVEGASPSLGRMEGLSRETLAKFARDLLRLVGEADPVADAHAALHQSLAAMANAVEALGRLHR
jgi:hypothetical protein